MIHSMNNKAKSGPSSAKPGARLVRLALAALMALVSRAEPAACPSAAEAKKQEISRVIAKEMTAAQKALQAQQWQEALKNLERSRDEVRA